MKISYHTYINMCKLILMLCIYSFNLNGSIKIVHKIDQDELDRQVNQVLSSIQSSYFQEHCMLRYLANNIVLIDFNM